MIDQAYSAEQAADYESDVEHTLPPQEARVWLEEIRALTPEPGTILDFGAGTGALLSTLKQAGLVVTGLEPSRHMIRRGLQLHPDLRPGDFLEGSAQTEGNLGNMRYDLIVSRQVLCHLREPVSVFARFHQWLRPEGVVLLVDGFWTSFSIEQKREFPLAGVRDVKVVGGLLAAAGFQVENARPYDQLNAARRVAFGENVERFVVVGRKPTSAGDPPLP